MKKAYVFGASGHGKVIIELLEANGYTDIDILDDADKQHIWQYSVVKPAVLQQGQLADMVIGVGVNHTRKKIVGRVQPFAAFLTPIHPSAVISNRVRIGEGTVVMAGVAINTDTVIGKHCIINTSASIDHDCVLEDYVHISPNATLSGDVQVGEGTHIGAGAVVIQCKRIGKWCTIGAGAVIIQDVPDNATVVGNPGRIIKVQNGQHET